MWIKFQVNLGEFLRTGKKNLGKCFRDLSYTFLQTSEKFSMGLINSHQFWVRYSFRFYFKLGEIYTTLLYKFYDKYVQVSVTKFT